MSKRNDIIATVFTLTISDLIKEYDLPEEEAIKFVEKAFDKRSKQFPLHE